MMRQFRTYIMMMILVLSGCTEPFNIQTEDSDPRIVIYGVLTDSISAQEIIVSSTAPYFDNAENPSVSGARINITSSLNRTIQYEENPALPGSYRAPVNWRIEEGETYTLKVEVDFDGDGILDCYEATTTVASAVHLDSIDVAPITIMGHENYAINIYGQDTPEEEYYLFHFYVNGTLTTTKLTDFVLTDDVMFNGEYIDGLTIQYFDAISEYENDSEEDRKRSIYLKIGDKVEVQTCVIPKGYFNFVVQCMNQKEGENPLFGGPPSNISTNISNGALGYFTAYTTSLQSGYVK